MKKRRKFIIILFLIIFLLLTLMFCRSNVVKKVFYMNRKYKIVNKMKDPFTFYEKEETEGEHSFGSLYNLTGWSSWIVMESATCTTDGYKERERICNDCGYIEKEVEIIKATGHRNDVGQILSQPTCTKDGLKTQTCSVCGYKTETVLRALGHNFSNWNRTLEPTCETEGKENRVCSRCNLTETRTIAALGHKGEWTILEEATCTSAGSKTRTCERCNEIETVVIDALGHDWTNWSIIQQATCTVDGIKTRDCNRCGLNETVTDTATGHNPSYTHNYSSQQIKLFKVVCNNCGNESIAETNVAALDMHILHTLKSPGCAQYKTYGLRYPRCTKCNQILWDEEPMWRLVVIGD